MNKDYYEYLKDNGLCEVCDSPSIELHHVKSRGSAGKEISDPFNVCAVCRRCHQQIHSWGNAQAMEKMPRYKQVLESKGWFKNSFNKLWNDRLESKLDK